MAVSTEVGEAAQQIAQGWVDPITGGQRTISQICDES